METGAQVGSVDVSSIDEDTSLGYTDWLPGTVIPMGGLKAVTWIADETAVSASKSCWPCHMLGDH